jgi:vacuolar-type H+-ATPase subunit E/Vma4
MLKNFDPLKAMHGKIIEDAENEALRLITQATKRADEILEAAKQESIHEDDVDKIRLSTNHQDVDRQRVSEAISEYTVLLSSYKIEIMDSIYKEALRRVKMHVDSNEYMTTLEGLIVEAGIALGGGDLNLWVNKEDGERVGVKLLARASAEITSVTGKETKLTLNPESLETLGGVKLAQAESKATVDNTFEGRLRRLREQKQSELESMVFG